MKDVKIIKADNKGRILLGKEFAGTFLGVNSQQNGIFLERIKFVPMTQEIKKEPSSKILQFAGSWNEIPQKDFNEFLKDNRKRRVNSGKKRNKF